MSVYINIMELESERKLTLPRCRRYSIACCDCDEIQNHHNSVTNFITRIFFFIFLYLYVCVCVFIYFEMYLFQKNQYKYIKNGKLFYACFFFCFVLDQPKLHLNLHVHAYDVLTVSS